MLRALNIFGWIGTAAVLAAYALASHGSLDPQGALFNALNLLGALGLGSLSYAKGVRPSVALNLVWGAVAIAALVRLLP